MGDLADKKAQRGIVRGKVTKAINKLKSSQMYCSDLDILKDQADNLENEYDKLYDLHEECIELGSEDLDYLQEITSSFQDCMKMYYSSVKAEKDKDLMKEAYPLQNLVDRDLSRIQDIIERIHQILVSDPRDLKETNLFEVLEDQSLLTSCVKDLLGNVDNLTKLVGNKEIEAKVNSVISKTDKINRDVKVLVKIFQNKEPVVSLSSFVDKVAISDSPSPKQFPTSHVDHSYNPQAVPFQPLASIGFSTSVVSSPMTSPTPYVPSTSSILVENSLARVPLTLPVQSSIGLKYASPDGLLSLDQKPNVHISQVSAIPFSFPQPVIYRSEGQHSEPLHMTHTVPSATIHTKKSSLPIFSGNRADWPEFRCVWPSLAESQYFSKVQLAMELKKSCKGKAAERIRHIYVTHDMAYEAIWARLKEEYDDPGLCSQEAINRLMSLRKVEDQDYPGIVDMIDTIDGIYCQLSELGQLSAIHAVDIDRVSSNLPAATRMEWLRRYRDLTNAEKLSPFEAFVSFLKKERAAVARLAEGMPRRSVKSKPDKFRSDRVSTHVGQGSGQGNAKSSSSCVVHDTDGHSSADCRNFKRLTVSQRYDALRKKKRCFNCFGNHPRDKCVAPKCSCGKAHHKLLCTVKPEQSETEVTDTQEKSSKVKGALTTDTQATGTHLVSAGSIALYPICQASLANSSGSVTIFFDGGSNASYVTTRCAQRSKFRMVDKVTLNVTTIGGKDKEYKSNIFETDLRTTEGKIVKVVLYELPSITGRLSFLNKGVVEGLFPAYDANTLIRNSQHVDILLGTDYFGLHPKQEVAKAGDNLSIMKGELGVSLVGTHPLLKESTEISQDVPKTLHLTEHRVITHHVSLRGEHPAFSLAENFIVGEELGTECNPKCGGCKCGKCPVPGHDLSFREEQELHRIRSNLVHDTTKKVWTTSYPWVKDPETLPDNYHSAFATLKSTERSLMKDPSWSDSYRSQIDDMVDRGVVRKLSQEEMAEWNKPFFYISHLAVSSLKSKSTPVRIVFNSAQVYKGVSLNSYLAKGPDSYRNTLLGILLRWREEAVPIVGDIRKMFHSVYINPLEQHCHRFLWRDLDTSRDPDVYVILTVTMGDKPAPAIATEALFMTADLFVETHPRAAKFIHESSYVDDLIDSLQTSIERDALVRDTEYVLSQGGFTVKCWLSSGQHNELKGTELKQTAEGHTGVLGVSWNPNVDRISFHVNLNFSRKSHGQRTGPDLRKEDVPELLPKVLTKRLVLQQVMGIYDPLGIIAPFTLLAKIHLRETWKQKLDWDDPLPSPLYK